MSTELEEESFVSTDGHGTPSLLADDSFDQSVSISSIDSFIAHLRLQGEDPDSPSLENNLRISEATTFAPIDPVFPDSIAFYIASRDIMPSESMEILAEENPATPADQVTALVNSDRYLSVPSLSLLTGRAEDTDVFPTYAPDIIYDDDDDDMYVDISDSEDEIIPALFEATMESIVRLHNPTSPPPVPTLFTTFPEFPVVSTQTVSSGSSSLYLAHTGIFNDFPPLHPSDIGMQATRRIVTPSSSLRALEVVKTFDINNANDSTPASPPKDLLSYLLRSMDAPSQDAMSKPVEREALLLPAASSPASSVSTQSEYSVIDDDFGIDIDEFFPAPDVSFAKACAKRLKGIQGIGLGLPSRLSAAFPSLPTPTICRSQPKVTPVPEAPFEPRITASDGMWDIAGFMAGYLADRDARMKAEEEMEMKKVRFEGMEDEEEPTGPVRPSPRRRRVSQRIATSFNKSKISKRRLYTIKEAPEPRTPPTLTRKSLSISLRASFSRHAARKRFVQMPGPAAAGPTFNNFPSTRTPGPIEEIEMSRTGIPSRITAPSTIEIIKRNHRLNKSRSKERVFVKRLPPHSRSFNPETPSVIITRGAGLQWRKIDGLPIITPLRRKRDAIKEASKKIIMKLFSRRSDLD